MKFHAICFFCNDCPFATESMTEAFRHMIVMGSMHDITARGMELEVNDNAIQDDSQTPGQDISRPQGNC